jgi:uncharacterized protein YbaP (TraB family)
MNMVTRSMVIALFSVVSHIALAASNEGVPALKVTAPNGQSSIIIGSAHVGIEGLRQPDGSVFDHAKRYVIEHVGNLPPEYSGVSPAGELAAWAKSLNQNELDEYFKRAKCANAEKIALIFLTQPAVQMANQIAYTICGPIALSRDELMSNDAKSHGIQQDELEDDAWVEAKRRSVPAQFNEYAFRWALAHDPKTVLSGIKDAMNNGDYQSVREQFGVSYGNATAAAVAGQIMINDRNTAWLPKLSQYLNEGQAVINVGASHLPGPNGLISLLQSSGYTVGAITLPERRSN